MIHVSFIFKFFFFKCVAYSAARFPYSRIQLLCMHVLTNDCFEFSHISHFIHSYVRYFMLLFFFSSPRGFLYFSHHEEHETRDVAIPFLVVVKNKYR